MILASGLTLSQANAILSLLLAFGGVDTSTFNRVHDILIPPVVNVAPVNTPIVTPPIVNPPVIETPVEFVPTITLQNIDGGSFTLNPNSFFSLVSVNVDTPSMVRNLKLRVGNQSFGTIEYPNEGINSFTPTMGYPLATTTLFTVSGEGLSNPDITVNVIGSDGVLVTLKNK